MCLWQILIFDSVQNTVSFKNKALIECGNAALKKDVNTNVYGFNQITVATSGFMILGLPWISK